MPRPLFLTRGHWFSIPLPWCSIQKRWFLFPPRGDQLKRPGSQFRAVGVQVKGPSFQFRKIMCACDKTASALSHACACSGFFCLSTVLAVIHSQTPRFT